jgi:hypothetical protein
VALIAVGTTAFTVISETIVPKDSALDVRYHGVHGGRVSLIVENNGPRGGVVRGARVYILTGTSQAGSEYPMDLAFDGHEKEEGFVPAGRSKFLRMLPKSDPLWKRIRESPRVDECLVLIDITEFRGLERMIVAPMTIQQCMSLVAYGDALTDQRTHPKR